MRTEDINTCTGWNKCISSPSVLLLYLNTCGYSENCMLSDETFRQLLDLFELFPTSVTVIERKPFKLGQPMSWEWEGIAYIHPVVDICLDVTEKLERFPSRQLRNPPDFGLICAFTFPTFAQVGAAITAVDMAKHIWHNRLPLAVGSPVQDFQILSAFSHLCQVGA